VVSEYLIRLTFDHFSQFIRASVGFSDGAIPDDDNQWHGQLSNSFAIQTGLFHYECLLAGETHPFELPEGSVRPTWNRYSVFVYGCGLVLDPEDRLAIFFTVNGKLLGKLVPEVLMISKKTSLV
jgi:hypothetical protein